MKKLLFLLIILVTIGGVFIYRYFNPKYYSSAYFNIETIVSEVDKDGDGVDDISDILSGAKRYIKTRPKYLSKYYDGGYPNDKYGVCTDVIAQAMLRAGYDLMALVDADRRNNPHLYEDEVIDKNIDFRRVRNLDIYFKNHWTSLSLDINDSDQWQPGDIVTSKNHIAMISDKRNSKGEPFIIHHAFKGQLRYEEDALDSMVIIGHYRVIKP